MASIALVFVSFIFRNRIEKSPIEGYTGPSLDTLRQNWDSHYTEDPLGKLDTYLVLKRGIYHILQVNGTISVQCWDCYFRQLLVS